MQKQNILFVDFNYEIDDDGAGAPTANSFVKNDVTCEFMENDLSGVKYFKVIFNCQVDTERNATPIETQALLKYYDFTINGRNRQFFIDKQNIFNVIFYSKAQQAQQFLDEISLTDTTITELFDQFWEADPIFVYVQVQIECVY